MDYLLTGGEMAKHHIYKVERGEMRERPKRTDRTFMVFPSLDRVGQSRTQSSMLTTTWNVRLIKRLPVVQKTSIWNVFVSFGVS